MTGASNRNTLSSWHRLLQEIELARNYHMPSMLDMFGATFRNPVLDYLVPSLLYLKLVAILDEALSFYIEQKNFGVPKNYKNTLHGRIEFLNEQGEIKNYCTLRKIKDLRNLLAHVPAETTDWAMLDADLSTIENELQELGCVGERPNYEFFAQRSAMRAGDEPGVDHAQDYQFGIKCDGRITMEVSFTRKILSN